MASTANRSSRCSAVSHTRRSAASQPVASRHRQGWEAATAWAMRRVRGTPTPYISMADLR